MPITETAGDTANLRTTTGSTTGGAEAATGVTGRSPRAAATPSNKRDTPAAAKAGKGTNAPLDTPAAEPPAEQRPVTIRDPQTMSPGIGSRLGDMLRWTDARSGDQADSISVLQAGIGQGADSMHRPKRWAARELVPSATGQEGTSPLPQVTSEGGSPLRLKLAPVSNAEPFPENPIGYPVAADSGARMARQTGLNQYSAPNAQAFQREKEAKPSEDRQSRPAPIRRAINTLVAKAGAIGNSVGTGAGLPAGPADRGTTESIVGDRVPEASNDQYHAEGPGIVDSSPTKAFAFMKFRQTRTGRDSTGQAAFAPVIENPERERGSGVEKDDLITEERGPRFNSLPGEPNRVRLLVRGTRAMESAGAGLLLLSRHFLLRRGGPSRQATGPDRPVEASPEANFQPSIAKRARPVAASEGDMAATKIRTTSEREAPGGEQRQSPSPGSPLRRFLTHSKLARLVRHSPSVNRLSGEARYAGVPTSSRPSTSPPAPGGKRLISRAFLAMSRIRLGLSSTLTLRESTPNSAQRNFPAAELPAGAVGKSGTLSGNDPRLGESPGLPSALSKGLPPTHTTRPSAEPRYRLANEVTANMIPAGEGEQPGPALTGRHRASIVRRAAILFSGARALVFRKSAPDVATVVNAPQEEILPQSREGAAGAAARATKRTATAMPSPAREVSTRIRRQFSVAGPGMLSHGKNYRGPSLLVLLQRKTTFQELMSVPRSSTLTPRTNGVIRRLPMEEPARESPTMSQLLDSAPDIQAREGLTMAGPPESAKTGPAKNGLTMAGLLESVNQPPEKGELILRASQPASRAGRRSGIGGTGHAGPDSSLTLRRQAVAPEARPEMPSTVPEPATSVRSRPHRRAERESSEPASDRSARDVTDFKGWEIEFLASRVFLYLQRKLDIERERHGQAGFNRWL